MTSIHFKGPPNSQATGYNATRPTGICRPHIPRYMGAVTTDRSKVTCPRCLKRLARKEQRQREHQSL